MLFGGKCGKEYDGYMRSAKILFYCFTELLSVHFWHHYITNDDIGDGDYIYPKHPNFKKGVFDLRKFTVLRDQSNVYFKVNMAELMRPHTYGSSDEKFTPCLVIAINKGKSGSNNPSLACHGIQFSQGKGYDLKLNI